MYNTPRLNWSYKPTSSNSRGLESRCSPKSSHWEVCGQHVDPAPLHHVLPWPATEFTELEADQWLINGCKFSWVCLHMRRLTIFYISYSDFIGTHDD